MALEKLNIRDRMVLLNILPPTGDITTLRIVRQLREALSFSEQEHAEFGIQQAGEMICWNPGVSAEKEIEIGPKALAIIQKTLGDMNKKELLREEHVPLYERFVGA